MITNKDIRRMIEEFNDTWLLDLKINRIIFWKKKGEAEYESFSDGSCILRINPHQRIDDFREDLFHELGHAILHQYVVPRKFMKLFHDSSPRLSRSVSYRIMDMQFRSPPANYVSWYALVTGTEDFCDTLSAWVCNGYKKSGLISYNNWVHNLNNEKLLKKKIEVIEKLLFYL